MGPIYLVPKALGIVSLMLRSIAAIRLRSRLELPSHYMSADANPAIVAALRALQTPLESASSQLAEVAALLVRSKSAAAMRRCRRREGPGSPPERPIPIGNCRWQRR